MTKLHWDNGTAYDLFVSLHILHRPADYNLRKAWAKGVRARLSQRDREALERLMPILAAPIAYLQQLPAPKNSQQVLTHLATIPPEERIGQLTMAPEIPADVVAMLRDIRGRGSWTEAEVDTLVEGMETRQTTRQKRQEVLALVEIWADAARFGEDLLRALSAYRDVFYAEEEERIRPVLHKAEKRARRLAEKLSLTDLIEELSQGVRVQEHMEAAHLTLVPSFWITPLVLYGRYQKNCSVMLFGARPAAMSLVPGDIVPDALHAALKALADPTRLRILRYLSQEPMTPAQLARRLRLRAPTVSHHLYTLRLARLVHLSIEDGDRRRYALRPGAIDSAFDNLGGFLQQKNEE